MALAELPAPSFSGDEKRPGNHNGTLGRTGERVAAVPRSADLRVCCVADFQTCELPRAARLADSEVGLPAAAAAQAGGTAGLETCAANFG